MIFGGTAEFFLAKYINKDAVNTNEPRVAPEISSTPDDRRRKMNEFARLSHKEKAV